MNADKTFERIVLACLIFEGFFALFIGTILLWNILEKL